jgi:hypothetical protein
MRKFSVLGLMCLLLISLAAVAEDNPYAGKIHKYALVERDKVVLGKGMTFAKIAKQFREAAAATNSNVYWIALTPITGDGSEVVFVTFFDKYAGLEQTLTAFDKIGRELMMKNPNFESEIGESQRSARYWLSEFLPKLSLNPDKVSAGDAKRYEVTTFHLRPGTAGEFSELVKEVMALHKKANDNDYWIAYRVVAGMKGSAYQFVTPLRSLADLDEEDTEATKAAFNPIVRKQLSATVRDLVLSVETNIMMTRPGMSNPSPEMVAANPDFWTVKEPAPMAPAKKGKKK